MRSVFVYCVYHVFFFKDETAYELHISDWSSDVCSSDLATLVPFFGGEGGEIDRGAAIVLREKGDERGGLRLGAGHAEMMRGRVHRGQRRACIDGAERGWERVEGDRKGGV